MTDIDTWLHDDGYDRIFRILEYRRVNEFSPDELEKKYIDISTRYLDNHYQHVKIREVIELPDKDILLGLQFIYDLEDLEKEKYPIEYRKLSQIELSYFPDDMDEDDWA